MKIVYSDKASGIIERLCFDGFEIPFAKGLGPSLRITEHEKAANIKFRLSGEKYSAMYNGLMIEAEYAPNDESFVLKIRVTNTSDTDFTPGSLDLILGIDTYMTGAAEDNSKFFPTMLRCEKTHFHGYFMSPSGNAFAVASPDKIASYTLEYGRTTTEGENEAEYGHRIHTASLSLLHKEPLPKRHPKGVDSLKSGESRDFNVCFIPLSSVDEYAVRVSDICGIPVITADLYTYPKNSNIQLKVHSKERYSITYIAPDGRVMTSPQITECGVYTVRVTTESGKVSEAKFYCRKPWEWYLKQARLEAMQKPQKATTHAESWYGFFSAFLAAKHYPEAELDAALSSHFDEVIPLMFDLDKAKPIVAPERIQNTSTLISVLTDKYEVSPEENKKYLHLASAFGDWLMTRQKDDGGYYKNNTLYTCVIYIAKSMLELCEAEKKAGMHEEYTRHYLSASRATEQLAEKLEDIQTEGEQTFEDGMISCSALQLGMYALTLPENKRKSFVDAAIYMDKLHACLEQKLVPDCRVNGASIRFWEAQYDIMFNKNFVCSPHGWSAWTAYAKYYLYLLTGKEAYLKELFNILGACVQLMSLDGNLRWAFANDPYIKGERLVPDTKSSIKDGYASVKLENSAYRGRYTETVVGEEYMDMVSGWYRTGEQRLTGGYIGCPLIFPDRLDYSADVQGGACDNDVHEIFKCLEETVLKKAFVGEREDGEVVAYNCDAALNNNVLEISFYEETEYLHTNFKTTRIVKVGEYTYEAKKGNCMTKIK